MKKEVENKFNLGSLNFVQNGSMSVKDTAEANTKILQDFILNLQQENERNKAEAEFYAEFSCIERTERLELPTWEEFSKWDKSIKFYNNSTKYSMYVFVKNKNTKNCRIIIYADNGEQDWFVFEQPLTQENYLKACRKCKELFLGE